MALIPHAGVTKAALFGVLAGIPVGIVWYQFVMHVHLLAALFVGAQLGIAGAGSAVLSYRLLRPQALQPIPVICALGGALAVVIAYATFRLFIAAFGMAWPGFHLTEVIPAAATGLFASYYAQKHQIVDGPSNISLQADRER